MENYFKMNLTKQEIDAISNLGLAHMGDCVYQILCRAYLCSRGGKRVDQLHKETINMVKATSQARFADRMLPLLTEEDARTLCPGCLKLELASGIWLPGKDVTVAHGLPGKCKPEAAGALIAGTILYHLGGTL